MVKELTNTPHYSYVERSPSGYVCNYARLVCDTVNDLEYLPADKTEIAIGSHCLCLEDGKTYVLDNAREWVEDLGVTNQGGYPEPEGDIGIVANGEYDVKDCATANVNVPASAVVSGTKSITSNGTYDITDYASASVNVAPSFVTRKVRLSKPRVNLVELSLTLFSNNGVVSFSTPAASAVQLGTTGKSFKFAANGWVPNHIYGVVCIEISSASSVTDVTLTGTGLTCTNIGVLSRASKKAYYFLIDQTADGSDAITVNITES